MTRSNEPRHPLSIGPATDDESDPFSDPYADRSIRSWPPYYDADGNELGAIDPTMYPVTDDS